MNADKVVAGALKSHQVEGLGLGGVGSPDICSCKARIFPKERVADEDISVRRHAAFAEHQAGAVLAELVKFLRDDLNEEASAIEALESKDEDGDSPTAITIRKIRAQGWREAAQYIGVMM